MCGRGHAEARRGDRRAAASAGLPRNSPHCAALEGAAEDRKGKPSKSAPKRPLPEAPTFHAHYM